MKSQVTAYKYAFLAVFLWSSVASAFKLSLQYLSSTELLLYASFISTVVFLTIATFENKLAEIFTYIKKNYKFVLLSALINPFLYYLTLFKAYDLLLAQEAQAINYTWALTLAFLSTIFLKQKLTKYDILAGIICYFGVLVIATKGSPFSLNFSNLQGVFIALLSTIFWSIYWILNAKKKIEPIIGLGSSFLVSFPMILAYYIFTQDVSIPNFKGLLGASYVGIFEMGITFLLWAKAMQSAVSTSKIANLIFLSPFISLIFIYFILGEKIYLSTVVGLIIIILGLILQQKRVKSVN